MAKDIAPTVTVAETIDALRIVDEITLKPGTATAFLQQLDAVYRPEVEGRGYRLVECTVSPPVDVETEPVHVRIQWSLDSMVEARAATPRWDLRLLRDAGPAATRFWDNASTDVIDRARRVVRLVTPPYHASWPAPAAGTTAAVAPFADQARAAAVRVVAFVHCNGAGNDMTSLHDTLVAELTDELSERPTYSHLCPHLTPIPATGDATWDIVLSRAAADRLQQGLKGVQHRLADRVTLIDAVTLQPLCGAVPEPDMTSLVKRTLLFKVADGADPDGVAALEASLVGMVDHIPAIRNWSLARVTPLATHTGIPRWTHAWEQEYRDLDGLQHDYLQALYHWAYVDTFYDSDHPNGVVEFPVGHVFGRAATSVLAPALHAIVAVD